MRVLDDFKDQLIVQKRITSAKLGIEGFEEEILKYVKHEVV